jgi:two-component system sensor histidine kinase HydH
LVFERPSRAVEVFADAEQLRQVLLNLMFNSLDAMPTGGTLKVVLDGAPGGAGAVRVLDEGSGIAPEQLPKLFQPFSSTKETGVGLGLVVSRRIVEDHGGSLEGENRSTGGACFTIRLPATRHGVGANSNTMEATRSLKRA